MLLWLACEIAIIACDLAEVIGTAIALKLLFGIPLVGGVRLTGARRLPAPDAAATGLPLLEAFVIALLVVIIGLLRLRRSSWRGPIVAAMLRGFVPSAEIVTNPTMLYIAIGILGATVMPHNLYLHSSIVQTRAYERTNGGKREADQVGDVDRRIALTLALFVNAAILILAAATFHHQRSRRRRRDRARRYELLTPLLGARLASTLFAIALLASGQNSTITGDAGRPDRDGGLSRSPAAELGTPAGHPRPRHRPGDRASPRSTANAAPRELLVFSQVVLSCSCRSP